MDLNLIIRAFWRHKFIMLGAIIIGVWLASTFAMRSYTTYESSAQLMLDTPSADLIKAGLVEGEGAGLQRTMELVRTYAFLVKSEPVLAKLRAEFGVIDESIMAEALEGVPIIEVFVTGANRRRVENLTASLAYSFQQYIQELQDESGIDDSNRVIVKTVGSPTSASPLSSRKSEVVLIMLMGPIFAGVLLVLLLENLLGGLRLKKDDLLPGARLDKSTAQSEA